MTDPNQPMGPPPSYDEVQNMSAAEAPPYPTQPYGYPNQPAAPGMPPAPQYPDQGGFKYDQYSGVPQYPMQQNYGQVPYPMQPGAQYPYGGAPAGVYPSQPGGQAVYNAQGGVMVQPMSNTNQMQRRRRLLIIIFVFVTVGLMIYMLSKFLF